MQLIENSTPIYYLRFFLLLLGVTAGQVLMAQVKVSGRVFDVSHTFPLESVSVLTTAGNGTVTDANGDYTVYMTEKDSIWFSYLNKPTAKYAYSAIIDRQHFEIALHVSVSELNPVRVMPRDYRMDSIQNRIDYADVFNYKKPGIDVSVGPEGGVGMDLDAFINMFHFRRNKRMVAFRERLEWEEKERFIDHRFSRALVIRLTQLKGNALDTFMLHYRPSLAFTEMASDYEFQDYIKKCFERYEQILRLEGSLKKED